MTYRKGKQDNSNIKVSGNYTRGGKSVCLERCLVFGVVYELVMTSGEISLEVLNTLCNIAYI